MPACLEWGEERHQECSRYEDHGYSSCDDWDKDCCDWWPCSWGCKLITWVCVAWVWISNIVCVAWTWITTAVCLVWDVITTIVNAVLVTLESIVGWVLDALAFIIELVLAIPILGRIIEWIWNLALFVFYTVLSLVDIVAGLIGIRPEKKLRLCTVILRDEKRTPIMDTAAVVHLVQNAVDVFRREANVRIIPVAPFQYDSGFAGGEQVSEDWVGIDGVADSDTLDAPCDAAGFGADLVLTGSKFTYLADTNCFFQRWRDVVGYGAPVACFVIRSIPDDDDKSCGANGCGLWITDYITLRRQPCPPGSAVDERAVAHELGHACNLWHLGASSNPDNLMGVPWNGVADLSQTSLSWWQVLLVRASKHVTYF